MHRAAPVPVVQLEAESRARWNKKGELGVLCGTIDMHKRQAEGKKRKITALVLLSVILGLCWKWQLWETSLPSGAHSAWRH